MKDRKTPSPKRDGNSKRMKAEALATYALQELKDDREALLLVVALVAKLAERSRGSRRRD